MFNFFPVNFCLNLRRFRHMQKTSKACLYVVFCVWRIKKKKEKQNKKCLNDNAKCLLLNFLRKQRKQEKKYLRIVLGVIRKTN